MLVVPLYIETAASLAAAIGKKLQGVRTKVKIKKKKVNHECIVATVVTRVQRRWPRWRIAMKVAPCADEAGIIRCDLGMVWRTLRQRLIWSQTELQPHAA